MDLEIKLFQLKKLVVKVVHQKKECSYNLIECIKNNKVQKCNECKNFPCDKINQMLERSKEHQIRCKEICTKEEYEKLYNAFFEKEINLKK